MKCHVCKEQEAEYSWQPLGPGENEGSFMLPGSHERGFPVVKVCLPCKSAIQSGDFVVPFTYKGHTYIAKDHTVQETNISLWNGGACSTESLNPSQATAIMLDTPESHELVALVFKDVPPTTPDLVKAFIIAPNLIEACEELDILTGQIEHYLDFSYVDHDDRRNILMTLARIHVTLERMHEKE